MDVLFGLGLYSTSVPPYSSFVPRLSWGYFKAFQAYHFIGMKKYLEKGMVFIPVSA
jgi:hypothetical protein